MKIYTVYTKPGDGLENAIFVKEGFSLLAAILRGFWAFYHKMWFTGIILFAVEFSLQVIQNKNYLDYNIIEAIKFGFLLMVGANFSDFYTYILTRRGYVLDEVILAQNEEEARYKFLSGMLQRSTVPAGNTISTLI